MKAHIVGTSTPNYDTKKTDSDEKKRIKNNLSQLLAFGMFVDSMADGGYIDGNRYWKESEYEVAKTEEDE